MTKFPDLDTNI